MLLVLGVVVVEAGELPDADRGEHRPVVVVDGCRDERFDAAPAGPPLARAESGAGREAHATARGVGVFGDAASKFLEGNSSYRTSADDFYAQELSRIQNKNAGQLSLAQQIFDAAAKRVDGIDQLREKISTAGDAKDIADLQARLQAETAFLQTDVLRMEALRMVQQAQTQIDEQRKAEDWRRRLDAMGAALQ